MWPNIPVQNRPDSPVQRSSDCQVQLNAAVCYILTALHQFNVESGAKNMNAHHVWVHVNTPEALQQGKLKLKCVSELNKKIYFVWFVNRS